MIRQDNIFYPVEYMIKQMMRQGVTGSGGGTGGNNNGGAPGDPSDPSAPGNPGGEGCGCNNCLDEVMPIRLERKRGRLEKVIGYRGNVDLFTVQLLYDARGFLQKVIGTCKSGYQETYTLIRDGKKVLTHVDVDVKRPTLKMLEKVEV